MTAETHVCENLRGGEDCHDDGRVYGYCEDEEGCDGCCVYTGRCTCRCHEPSVWELFKNGVNRARRERKNNKPLVRGD